MNIFLELSLILAVATAMSFLMQMIRQPLILGHILTGIIVGPAVFNILHAPTPESFEVFSRLGIITLLFIVGLGLSPKIIKEVGKVAIAAGLVQVVCTSILGYFIGKGFGFSDIVSAYLAVAFTFSSTIIISKILSDKHELHTLHGKISIGILLVQDLVATLALILVTATMSGGRLQDAFLFTLAKGILLVGGIVFASWMILPSLTRIFARSQEFLYLFAIAWGIGSAAVFHACGLSAELGALSAGIALSTSPYHYEISAKMKLLRDFFIVLFFIVLGSQLSASRLSAFAWPIAAYSAFILIANPLIIMAIMGAMGYAKKTFFNTGLAMAQVSEFSLILIMLGIRAGHVSNDTLSIATIVAIITISISTIMMLNSERLYPVLAPFLQLFERKNPIIESSKKQKYSALLFGCHRVGADFLPSIMKRGYPFLVVDFDPQMIARLKEQRIPCRYGDVSDDGFLDSFLLEKCKLIISTIPDFETNAYILNRVRKINSSAVIILIAQHIYEAETLYDDGASYVVMPHHMGGNYAAMLIGKHGADARLFNIEKQKHLKHLEERHAFQLGH
ncbi:MAG: cation:proton antiporter [Patescibacteria group bacterium]